MKTQIELNLAGAQETEEKLRELRLKLMEVEKLMQELVQLAWKMQLLLKIDQPSAGTDD